MGIKQQVHVCEGCGEVERLTSALPPDWKGYGTSAYRIMATAEWCPDCVAMGVMERDGRTTAQAATDVLLGRFRPKYTTASVEPVAPRLPDEDRSFGTNARKALDILRDNCSFCGHARKRHEGGTCQACYAMGAPVMQAQASHEFKEPDA